MLQLLPTVCACHMYASTRSLYILYGCECQRSHAKHMSCTTHNLCGDFVHLVCLRMPLQCLVLQLLPTLCACQMYASTHTLYVLYGCESHCSGRYCECNSPCLCSTSFVYVACGACAGVGCVKLCQTQTMAAFMCGCFAAGSKSDRTYG